MTSARGMMDMMGIGDSDAGLAAQMARAMGAVTKAWKCDTCGEWICNECVCSGVTSGSIDQIQHSNCGGMFRAP